MVPIKDNRFSFTLIELLVVIAVLGILAVVAGVNLSSWNCKQKARNDFSGLNGALQTLGFRAENTNKTTRATIIEDDNGNYILQADMRTDNVKSCEGGDWTNIESLNYTFNEDTQVSADSSICFYSNSEAISVGNIIVSRQCSVQVINDEGEEDIVQRSYRYKSEIISTTGFIDKHKQNIQTEIWEEL